MDRRFFGGFAVDGLSASHLKINVPFCQAAKKAAINRRTPKDRLV